jgi:hypothetical protein
VNETGGRRYRAGEPIEDLCRACKTPRAHTVMAVDALGRVVRVVCDFCHSEHNFRGGASEAAPRPARTSTAAPAQAEAMPLVSERERSGGPVAVDPAGGDLEMLLRRVLREELGLTPTAPADKWRGGELVLRPGRPGLQEKSWPIETFFHKVVMLRNRLRTLEQQINAAELPSDAKLRLHGYITACYGSLTSFNVLFAQDEDQFHGSGGEE